MKHRKPASPWKRTIGLAALGTAAGVLVGAGGTTLALWNTGLDFGAQTRSGYEYFAAGTRGATTPASNGKVTVILDANEAAKLKNERAVAIVLETQSVSQGNTGLRYTIEEPDWGDHIFGASSTQFYRVSSPAECTVDKRPRVASQPTSTPVRASYSGSDEPVVEYWCLVAAVDSFPDEGTHNSSVTVTGHDPADVGVKATDDWHAEVTSTLDPAQEPTHRITFRYETFRPTVDAS